jgi:hypothetical protein
LKRESRKKGRKRIALDLCWQWKKEQEIGDVVKKKKRKGKCM